MAFHQPSLGLFDRRSLFQGIRLAGLGWIGSIGREQFRESPVRHLEDGQRFDEELRCRLCDVLELAGGPVGLEHVQQHGMVDPGQVEDAQPLSDRPAAELVGCPASRLAALGEVLQECGRVVTPEPLLCVPGQFAPCRV